MPVPTYVCALWTCVLQYVLYYRVYRTELQHRYPSTNRMVYVCMCKLGCNKGLHEPPGPRVV